MPSQQEAFVIGLSGPSSSGKTTLARLLRDIWPRTFILHEDDFYWPDSQIPVKNGVQDWDCFEAIDLSTLQDTLEYIRAQGDPPESFVSKEDQNSIGDCPVDQQVIRRWRERAESLQRYHHRRIAVIDGFLLYAEAMDRIWKQLDVKLFLRTDLTTAKTRREFRSGYVTLEGFWQDPPGYVENVVWPNYVKDHAHLFQNGNVEGEFDSQTCQKMGLNPVPRYAESDMTACLEWACTIIERAFNT